MPMYPYARLFRLGLSMLIAGLILLLASCDSGSDSQDDTGEFDLPGWRLVWQDEFNGNAIDDTKWSHEVNADGGGNNELQYYTDRAENSYVENGSLVIQALSERFTGPGGTRDYTSARLRSLFKGDWLYGRFDVRAKLPIGRGLWPAVWMLPSDWQYGGWAASGEIDIMELVGHEPSRVHGTIHHGASFPNNISTGDHFDLVLGTFNDDYHLFTLEWEETEMRWYVDGIHYLTINDWSTTGADFPAPFDKRFHMLLNVAVGGNWPGSPDASTVFPQTMEIDYVRVYEKTE